MNQIYSIDGILLTHMHYDHSAGIDDIRFFYYKTEKAIPCLLSSETLEYIKLRYPYLFNPIDKTTTTFSNMFDFHLLDDKNGENRSLNVPIRYFSYFQNKMKVLGFRLGNFAYVTDIRTFDEDIFVALKGVKQLVISALRYTPSENQFSIQEAMDFSKKVGALTTWFTHIAHEIDHNTVSIELDEKYKLAYDGLEISFTL